MKKLIICFTMILALCLSVFAGDVAEYTDLGFSPDGKYFVFAQYGVTDKDFEPYAEIYTVDVAKNDFLKNGIYKVNPGTIKSVKSGFAVFSMPKFSLLFFLNKFSKLNSTFTFPYL